MTEGIVKKSLFALALGGFGIGTTEFSIMGLLPNVSDQLHITIPEAGHLISAYAAGVVIGAPLLTAAIGRRRPKSILLFLMILFTVFNGISALAPNFYVLMLFRLLAGLPHGAFFGVGAVIASRLAERGKEASAVAVMFGGLTLANVFGVPFATFIGYHLGWRAAFALVAVIGLVTLAALKLWLPELDANSDSKLSNELKIFKRPELWLVIAITSIGFAGFFAWISYIAPLLTQVTGFSSSYIPGLMIVAGIGMTIGNHLGGKFADRFSPLPTVIVLMASMIPILMLNGVSASSKILILPLTILTGSIAMAQVAPIQMLLMENSEGSEMLGSSIGQASFNIGNSLGAFFGGIPLVLGYSYASPQWVGAMMSFLGVLLGLILFRRTKAKSSVAQIGQTDLALNLE